MSCDVYNVLSLLDATPKRNEKISILTEHSDLDLLNKVLFAALDPYTQYNIRKIPPYTSNGNNLSIGVFLSHLNEFSERIVTGNAAIERLTVLLADLTPEAAIVAERIIKKDLRCGVQASTVNKVYEQLIPTYPCLLAKPYDEKSIARIAYPAYSQIKADGMRVNVHYALDEDGTYCVIVRGRSGKLVNLHGYLDDAFNYLGKTIGGPVVFDGEMVVLEKDGTVMSRKKGNGILNKAVKGTISEDEASRVRVRLWDVIHMSSFLACHDGAPYSNRYGSLDMLVNDTPHEKYEMIETVVVHSFEEAMDHYRKAITDGQEGTIIKNMSHPWEDTRSKHLVKLKAEEECDLEVVGYNPGAVGTKNENKMGSLICESSDGKVVVSISGFSDDLRDEITENIQEWIGRIVTVRYNERIADKSRSDVDSLFLPRFQELREDKDEADCSDVIK